MKQIFDWLREQMRNKAYKAWDGDNKREIMLITLPVVENIINEAEAKWEAVIEQMEEYRAKFDCRTCKHNKTEGQVCTKDCTDALIDEMLEILKSKISEVER